MITTFLQPLTPLVYEVVEKPTSQTTVLDVVFGAFAVVGGLAVVGILLGILLAGMLIMTNRFRSRDALFNRGSKAIQLGLTSYSQPK